MPRTIQRTSRVEVKSQQKPVILLGVLFLVSLPVLSKTPDPSSAMLSFVTFILRHLEMYGHLDLLTIRFQEDFLQTLPNQFLQKGEWASLDLRPRSISVSMKLKYVFMISSVDVSVIVPTLNEEKYLSRCLKSLRTQLHEPNFETIVIDGGSVDQTLAIAKKYADKVLVEKGRVGAARNKGAQIAKGDILAFIDADTMASDHWLHEIVKFFRSCPGAVGATGPTLPYDGGTVDSITYKFWTIYLQRMLLAMGMPHVIGFNCAYRRKAFLQAGGFDEAAVMSEDIKLAQKMRQFGKIVFDKRMSALTSARRFQRCGHAYITGLYLLNGFSTLLLQKSSRNYPPIR